MSIVAAVDQSERAEIVLQEANKLATALDVELHIVHVSEFSIGNLVSGSTEDSTDIEDAREDARSVAKEIGARVDPNHEFEAVGLVGDPAEEIVTYSEDILADYIVMSGRKKTPTGKALFGSVTQSVLLDANRPVVSVME